MRFSWLVLPALAATVAWRLAVASEGQGEDRDRMLADVAALLAQQGFATRIDLRDGPDAVLATRGACALAVVADIPANGGIELFQRRYGSGRTVRMFYQDGYITQLPRWRMAWNYYRQRHLAPLGAPLGFDLPYPPLVMVAAGVDCAAAPDAIDWGRLQFHSLPPALG